MKGKNPPKAYNQISKSKELAAKLKQDSLPLLIANFSLLIDLAIIAKALLPPPSRQVTENR
jgi:hypothetical protein